MSQEFKFSSDEFKDKVFENERQNSDDPHYRVYSDNGHIRNFIISWQNGNSIAYPYAFVLKLEYLSEDGRIIITMTTGKILIHGIRLKTLFNDLFYQLPLEIIVIDKRYNLTADNIQMIVNKIELSDS